MRNRIIFSFIILLTLFLSICAISASENVTCDNLTSADADSDMELLSVGDVEDNADANKSSTEISAEDKVSYVDYEDTFTVKLTSNGTDLANKSIIITLNDEKYNKTTDLNGQVSIKFKLKAGVYNVTYFFDGDENYTSSNGTSTLTVKSDLKTSLDLIDKNTNYCEGVLAVFQLKLVVIYGNPVAAKCVRIKVAGKTYTAKTNSKGVATIYVSLKKGTNTLQYYFYANGQYLESSGSKTIVVKSNLSKGNGYWVNKWSMKKVNLKKLSKRGAKHIFLLHTVFDKYG